MKGGDHQIREVKIIWLIASSKIGAVETAIPREVPQEFAHYGEQVIPLSKDGNLVRVFGDR